MSLKQQILKLRNDGKSYSYIQKELKCAKSTISYHCGEGQIEKTTNRRIANRAKQHPLVRKIENFQLDYNKPPPKSHKEIKTFNRILRLKIEKFSVIQRGIYNSMSFTIQEFLNKVGDNPTCALTGKPIDLMKPKSYQLDHIVPRSKGGDNSLDNCQLTLKEANQAKNDLSMDEFIALCREIVTYYDNKAGKTGFEPVT